MKKAIIIFSAITMISSCNKIEDNLFPIRGKGPTETFLMQIGSFNCIKLRTDVQVFIDSSSNNSITIESQKNIYENLDFILTGQTLIIDNERPVYDKSPVKIHIGRKLINSLNIKGSGSVSICGPYTVDAIELEIDGSGNIEAKSLNANQCHSRISGSGDISLSGNTSDQNISISGSGNYHSFGLFSRNADVNISGSGNCEVKVADKLNVEINGSGDVQYMGDPNTTINISGSGKVRHK